MGRTVYVNGAYLPEEDATVSVFDRGFLFADGVYEVCAVLGGKPVDFDYHLSRLARSLGELQIPAPLSDDELRVLHAELIARNALDEGIVYLEITRGAADRDFAFPKGLTPTVVAFTQAKTLADNPAAETGVKVVTIPDIRWKRRDIKSVALLPQTMGKQEAKSRGAYEAWMVEDGFVTEGTSSTAFIVDAEGVLRTQPLGHQILPGVTRRQLLEMLAAEDIRIEERPFTVDEAKGAREAFLTAASAFVLPIVEIDGVTLGDGKPGPISTRFRALYLAHARSIG
ncbi:D-amino-acid transaminase [Methyloligella sp. 2.7D]|uniref:D-amino-acid transaminase n=1 Tax=unclassified Methyloligella TaxID=2625955 RepID=UPI00157DEE57|nr:D-amino-acid transaminase [Methyloligella sp. GL2]QKP77909.1 D-amino-acid transaminase [Methyloligella sp. GL2]